MRTFCYFMLPLLGQSVLAEPGVKLAGIQAVFDPAAKEFDGFGTFNLQKPGLRVVLLVRDADKKFVGFDEGKAAVKIGGVKAECHFFANMAIAKDGHAMRLEFDTEKPVKPGPDGSVRVTGGLPVVMASGKEEVRGEPFAVKPGATVKLPAGKKDMPALTVKSTGKPKWGDRPFEIELSTDKQADPYPGLLFFTKDGKPVKAERTGSSWGSFLGGKPSGTVTYAFDGPQTELIVAVELWTGREEKTLQVDMALSLGGEVK